MEKSIEHGLDYYIGTMPGTEKKDTKDYSPLALAYIGDCVFDLVIKTRVAARGSRQVHKLHEETSHYVQASFFVEKEPSRSKPHLPFIKVTAISMGA